jgi:hypothetical protein
MRELPDGADPRGIDPSVMLQTRFGEYWDSDRATYEDELNAWRERTSAAAPIVSVMPARARPVARRRVAARTVAPRRQLVAPRRHLGAPRSQLVAPRNAQSSVRRRQILANQPSGDS